MNTATTDAPVADPFHGELLDADGHVYSPPQILEHIDTIIGTNPTHEFLRAYVHTEEFRTNREKNRAELWDIKGMGALGAYDAAERVEALEAMGVKAQLLYPNTGGAELRMNTDEARVAARFYNDYALDFTQRTQGKARAVCEINMGKPDWAIGELDRVLKLGARCVMLPINEPPGGVSPAHEVWDPFWARLEEANVPATIHLGGQGILHCKALPDLMFPTPAWADAASLRNKPAFRAGGEEAISPYFMLVTHMAPELFLQTMVMGKVFERFPALRFGIIELGASWLGPACERMDLWSNFMNKVGVKYSMKPSEFVRRNVRVTPFWHENLPLMINRYGLQEAYVFSTDYPHFEGSRDPVGKFRRWTKELDPAYARAFFIDNARLLLPGA